ncbi:MAG: XRE family transcriptional regulator [Sphingomonas sp.]|uniref:helix-turn-helix domain-containing protein n=1 Tax=Sphingopyxis sp. MG TaxID=1866325 RepID=UPI000CDF3692|nr:helix-turn-helix transcriptional regulator [Sphingopyxis sp. MG]AVA15058.1 XRE family transcriptional regulator [Sphingopyxis sp. MG]MBA4048694.1 XRE family transcriptional regulator [Sphingomonas sp.]
MGSPKSKLALERLGQDIRGARLRRGIAIADLAVRSGTSPSSIARLEKGDSGVGIGTLADVLVALGLIERLSDLVDIRKDDLGLALATQQLPKRGKTFASSMRKQKSQSDGNGNTDSDPEGIGF